MKLFYYETQSPSKNFGDELNPWLWPRLLPERLILLYLALGQKPKDEASRTVRSKTNEDFSAPIGLAALPASLLTGLLFIKISVNALFSFVLYN